MSVLEIQLNFMKGMKNWTINFICSTSMFLIVVNDIIYLALLKPKREVIIWKIILKDINTIFFFITSMHLWSMHFESKSPIKLKQVDDKPSTQMQKGPPFILKKMCVSLINFK